MNGRRFIERRPAFEEDGMDHNTQLNSLPRHDEFAARAFQVDPGWYEAYWLARPESKPLWAIHRIKAGFWALAAYVGGLRLALSELPSEIGYRQSDFRIDAFPTWFGRSGPGA
jgi:hypothetical protein